MLTDVLFSCFSLRDVSGAQTSALGQGTLGVSSVHALTRTAFLLVSCCSAGLDNVPMVTRQALTILLGTEIPLLSLGATAGQTLERPELSFLQFIFRALQAAASSRVYVRLSSGSGSVRHPLDVK